MEVLENKITELTDDLADLEFGSEEFERATNSIAAMAKANADDKKVENDVKKSKVEKITMIATAAAAVVTAGVGVLREILRRKTNKDVMTYEKDDVITSKAFDNR